MKKNKKKKGGRFLGWIALALVAAILAALPMLNAGQEETSGTKASLVSAHAGQRDVSTVLMGGGQLESSGVYSVKIPENILLEEYLVHNGDTVREGDPIARVDPVSVMTAISRVQDTLTELSTQINDSDTSSGTTTGTISATPSGTVKVIYARKGDNVQDVMLNHGCLAVISLDGVMAVDLAVGTTLSPGDKVNVIVAGTQVTGRVRSNVSGVLTVTVDDDSYSIGTDVTVKTTEGQTLGSGSLYVFSPWNVTAISGTISAVSVKEGQSISKNQALFTVTESGKSAEYQQAIDKRRKYEALMQELFEIYNSGVVTAPCDGIVSGVDATGAYMLSCEEEDGSLKLVLLADVSFPVNIITASLPGGTVGVTYGATLQAASGSALVYGTWAASGLPAGLTITAASGLISGTPTAEGTFHVTVSFLADGSDDAVTRDYTLIIGKQPTYYAYAAKVLETGGEVIRVLMTTYPVTVNAPDQAPSQTITDSELTSEYIWRGQAIVDGHFSAGDYVWIILDGQSNLVGAVSGSSSGGGSTPGGGTTPGSGGSTPGSGGGTAPGSGSGSEGSTTPGSGSGSGGSGGSGFSGGGSGFSGGGSGFSGGGSGFSGGGSGFSGGSGSSSQQEDDGLYSLTKTSIATITSQEQMTVTITVDELDITKIYVGQKAEITMNAFSIEPVEATVSSISNSGENSGGNSKFTVELVLAKSGEMLPGMNASAAITLDTAENALCVPAAAVYEVDGKSVVYTAKDEKTGTLSAPVEVATGKADADYVQILSGLSPDATVWYELYETDASPAVPQQSGRSSGSSNIFSFLR